VAKHKMLKMFW